MISLLPIGKCDRELLEYISGNLDIFNMPVKILTTVPLPPGSYNKKRRQYRARKFLSIAGRYKGDRVLGITKEDLYVKELNYVFGLARKSGKCAVISVARLGFGDEKKLYERSLKEAVHEIGHTMGLDHCSHRLCVMHFSNCLLDTDEKTAGFCHSCKEKLEFHG